MMRGLLAALLVAGFSVTGAAAQEDVTHTVLGFHDLAGWDDDNHQAAFDVFLETCADMKSPEWATLCALAERQSNPKTFFELFFKPVLIEDGTPALFTGYFEPELNGSRSPSGRYKYPIYRKPAELDGNSLWYSRREIEEQGLLSGRGLEIAWVDDPVDVFFLQIQGSGRIRLDDGSTIRVGFGGSNGHQYRSIGEELVRRGVYDIHQVSAQVIRNWVKRNPMQGLELLRHNPTFVFFRTVRNVSAKRGPLGAMNRSITTNRSVAVDPAYVPLGAPVWLEKGGRNKFNRLMIAQDTGSAIKGPQRADIFYGTGYEAGQMAGRVRDPGRLVVLMPIQEAYARAEGLGE